MTHALGIIGAGNMAEAIVRGAIDRGELTAKQLIAADPAESRRAVFERLGVRTTEDNAAVVAEAQRILLAVKPQSLDQIAPTLQKIDAAAAPVISIMAGISTARLARAMAADADRARLVRVMPNTPLLVGLGMAGIAGGPGARPEDLAFTERLFRSAGRVVRVDESQMDAITAVSGSGPAYLYYLAEAMVEAAGRLGLDAEQSGLLVEQTLLGAATLLREADEPPAELRRRVSSPGGTTEAAINQLEGDRVREHLVAAIERAAQRSAELGA